MGPGASAATADEPPTCPSASCIWAGTARRRTGECWPLSRLSQTAYPDRPVTVILSDREDDRSVWGLTPYCRILVGCTDGVSRGKRCHRSRGCLWT